MRGAVSLSALLERQFTIFLIHVAFQPLWRMSSLRTVLDGNDSCLPSYYCDTRICLSRRHEPSRLENQQ
jgi:hypothetical protein